MVARFVSIIMNKGKKTIAENIIYGALEIMKDKTPEDSPLKAFNKAIENARRSSPCFCRRRWNARRSFFAARAAFEIFP